MLCSLPADSCAAAGLASGSHWDSQKPGDRQPARQTAEVDTKHFRRRQLSLLFFSLFRHYHPLFFFLIKCRCTG